MRYPSFPASTASTRFQDDVFPKSSTKTKSVTKAAWDAGTEEIKLKYLGNSNSTWRAFVKEVKDFHGGLIPTYTERKKAEKAAKAGLSKVKQEGDETAITFSMNDERFYTFLEDAYTHANQTLLQLLLKDQDLIPRLRSLKRYFFLSQSFFLTHLLDLASNELRKSTRSASLVKLIISMGGLGSERVGESEVGNEEAKKEQKDDKKPLLASDTLALDYHVKFPLSLVISRKTILRYQLIFRFLLHLKNVEQSLGLMWIEQKTTPWQQRAHHTLRPSSSHSNSSPTPTSTPIPTTPAESSSSPSPFPSSLPSSSSSSEPEFKKWHLRVFLLRARMLAFIQQILSFVTFEVLELNWRALEVKLDKVTTVDQLLRDHLDFLDTCLKECMLTSAKLLKAYNKLIVTCATFALYAAPYTKSANQAISGTETAEGQRRRWEYQLKFEKNFDHWFKVFLDCVQFYASSENGSLLPLVVCLSSISRRSTST
ncbi:MAG: Spc98 family-domain-containing protein [Lentinula lateritia]|nr:MAG: Spc98 family-domain-containing protein [Lentinula lateritia]